MNVIFVVIEQGWLTPATKHEVAPENELVAMRLLEVIIFKSEPAFVWKLGFIVKEIKLSDVCIHEILLG